MFRFRTKFFNAHMVMLISFYKRKLSMYYLTTYSLGDSEGNCYMWDETLASRGACEIASCIMMFLKTTT